MESERTPCKACGKTYLNCIHCLRSQDDIAEVNFHHDILAKMSDNYDNSFVKNIRTTPNILERIYHVENVRFDQDRMISRWSNFILNALGQDRLMSMKPHQFQIVLCNFALMQAVFPSNWSQVPPFVKSYLKRTTRTKTHSTLKHFMAVFNHSLIKMANQCKEMEINDNEMRFLLTLSVVDNHENQCSSEEPEVAEVWQAMEFFEQSFMKDENFARYAKLCRLHDTVIKLVKLMDWTRLLSPLVHEYRGYPIPSEQMDALGAILFRIPPTITL